MESKLKKSDDYIMNVCTFIVLEKFRLISMRHNIIRKQVLNVIYTTS